MLQASAVLADEYEQMNMANSGNCVTIRETQEGCSTALLVCTARDQAQHGGHAAMTRADSRRRESHSKHCACRQACHLGTSTDRSLHIVVAVCAHVGLQIAHLEVASK